MGNLPARSTVIEQLRTDFPNIAVDFQKNRNLLIMGSNKINLLMNYEEFANVNVHSNSGRNYYQAIVQLVYSNCQLEPQQGSYADGLIIYREDYNKFRLQNLARDYGIGFLEGGSEVTAVEIDADFDSPLMIEEPAPEPEKLEELEVIED